MLPFVWMFYNTFKTNMEFNHNIWSLPAQLEWQNYVVAFKKVHVGVYMVNSIIITSVAVLVNLSLGAMVAYVIARFAFFGRDFLYKLFIAGLLMPQILTVIPFFFLMREFHLYNTRLSVIIAYIFWGMPFAVFLLVAFFKTLPRELEQSAMIDGCSHFKTFSLVMLPLARPGLITVGVFHFLEFWSTYILPLTLIGDTAKKPLALGLVEFLSGLYDTFGERRDWGAMFAAAIICILPVLVVYAVFQRKLIAGLTAGSLKG
ncbi:MAG: carbohydrate ABC transporter permease [Spirochaetales bacterium]|nr:carbohydrate ABC transporter permease [Spirochaetales bacterium]